VTEEESPTVHSSDVTGLALVDTRDTPDTSGVYAYTDATMLAYIKHKESSGNPNAQNPTSSAYGLYGFLNSTWSTVGCVKTSDPVEQERCALLYIEQRYGSIAEAYNFHLRNNYY